VAIEETIAVGVSGLGDVTALADALDKAAASAARLDEAAGKGFSFSGAASGAGKLADSYEAAFARIQAQFDAMEKRMASMGKAAGGDSAAASLGAVGEAGKAAAAGLDSAAASGAAAGDALKSAAGGADSAAASFGAAGDAAKSAAAGADAVAGSGAAAADGLKSAGAGADAAAGQLAALRAEMTATAASADATAAATADANAKIARGQRLNTMAARDASAEAVAAQRAQSAASRQAAEDAAASSSKHSAVVLGLAAALGYGTEKAAQLQTSVTKLYTSAGESRANLPMISQGILAMSGATDTSQADLAAGAYFAESAGFHGRNALAVTRAAAQGAKAEGANVPDVANALTTVLNDYFGGPAKTPQLQQKQATQAMNEIIASVGQGKMTLQGLSTALPVLLPTAKTAGLKLPQVLGAEATMTAGGTTPENAAQEIRYTVQHLQKLSNPQAAEMQMLGINPVQLQHDLGRQGLTGTIGEVDNAIQKHMGPGGMVLLDTMNQAKLATQSAREEIAAMPPSIRKTAEAYLSGSINAKAFNQAVRQGPESARDANLLKQFESTASSALGFSQLVKSGQGNQQTVAAALATLMGGQPGMQVAEQVGGADHLKTFGDNVRTIGDTAAHTGDNIRGWNDIQGQLNFKLGSFVHTAEAVATEAGQMVLPDLTKVLGVASGAGQFLASHPAVTQPLMAGGGILAAGYALQKVRQPVTAALQGAGKIGEALHIPGLDKLANIGKDTGLAGAATGLTGAATSLDGAAASLEGAAASLKGGSLAGAAEGGGLPGAAATGERAAGSAAEKDAALAGEEAAGGSFLSKFLGGAKSAAGGLGEVASRMVMPLAVAATVKQVGDQLAPAGSNAGKITSITQHSSLAGPSGSLDIGGWFGLLAQHMPDLFGSGGRPQTASLAGGGRYAALSGDYRQSVPAPYAAPRAAPAPLPAESQMPHLYAAAGHPGTMTGGPPVKIPAPDLSAVEGATAKAKNALNTLGNIQVKPVKVPAPDTSAVDSASAKVKGAMTALSSMHINPLRMPAADLSALDQAKAKTASDMNGITGTMAAAAGPARAAGAAVAAGMAGGISAGTGAAVAAAHQLAAEVESALNVSLQVHSPSKVSEHSGEEFSAGLASGIDKGKTKAKKSAAGLSASTVNSLVTGLQGGQSAVDAAMAALGSPAKPQDITTIEATVAKLKSDLAAGLKKGDVSKSEDSALTTMLDRDNQKLQRLAAQRTKLETEIASAQQLGQSAISEASILNAGQAAPAESITAQASSQTVQGMQYQAQQQQQFASQLAQLQKQGLNAQSISQLAQGGAAAGLPVTEGLVGDKSAISQINQSEKQIMAAAGSIGNTGAPAMYQAGQQVASQLGKGLQGQLKAVDNQMKSVAHGMVSAVEAGLNGKGLKAAMAADGASAGQGFASGLQSEIPAASAAGAALAQAAEAAAKAQLQSHSPSLVFRRVGFTVPEGFAQGIGDGAGPVSAAAGRMASGAAAHAGMMHPYGGGGGGTPSVGGFSGGGGGTQVVHHHYNITVQGSVTTERDLFNAMQDRQLERSANNYRGGWNLPYKGA